MRKALVIGGGIAGPVTAMALQTAGIDEGFMTSIAPGSASRRVLTARYSRLRELASSVSSTSM